MMVRRGPDSATATGWPASMATACRMTLGAAPGPHVRTVPSPDMATAHDASGAMATAASCTKAAIDMEYRRP